ATTEIYTLSLHDALPISMALHRDHGVGEIGQNGFQSAGLAGQRIARVAADLALIVVEVGVLRVRTDAFLDRLARRRGWRRWRSRRRRGNDRHRGGPGNRPSRTCGRQGVSGGVGGRYLLAAGAADTPDCVIDRYTGGLTADFPPQRGGLTALNRCSLGAELRHNRRGCRGWRPGGGGGRR